MVYAPYAMECASFATVYASCPMVFESVAMLYAYTIVHAIAYYKYTIAHDAYIE